MKRIFMLGLLVAGCRLSPPCAPIGSLRCDGAVVLYCGASGTATQARNCAVDEGPGWSCAPDPIPHCAKVTPSTTPP